MTSPSHTSPPVVLLTDFGTADHYVGVMKGVIAGIAPWVPTIDLTHEVAPQDVHEAGCALLFGYRFFPAGSIFLCVVDPGVGSERRAIGLELEGPNGPMFLICPDNGLLSPLLASGGASVSRAVELNDLRFHLPAPSATFHGRDVFAPAAAHLAAGRDLSEMGAELAPTEVIELDWSKPVRQGDEWLASVIYVDRFGNLITNLAGSHLGDDGWTAFLSDGAGDSASAAPDFPLRTTFADVDIGSRVAYVGSSGFVELAIRQGSAARDLAVARGALVRLHRL